MKNKKSRDKNELFFYVISALVCMCSYIHNASRDFKLYCTTFPILYGCTIQISIAII